MKIKKIRTFKCNSWRILTNYWYLTLEFLSVKSEFFYNVLTGWRKKHYIKAVKLAQIKKEDKVLFIGSGIIPSQAIFIVKETGMKVHCIDNSKKVISLSKKYIKKINLTDKIKIEFAGGEKFDVSLFNVVFIAINVWPINEVLTNISMKLKPGSRIICKSYHEDIPMILKNQKLNRRLEIKEKSVNPRTYSYLLKKKDRWDL